MAVQDVGFILPSVGKSPFRGNAIELNKSQGKVFVADKNLVYLT